MSYAVSVDVNYDQDASRLELFIRMILGLIFYIVAAIWGIVVYITMFFQFLHILFLGRRNEGLFNFGAKWWRFVGRLGSYMFLLTDERPSFD